MKCKLEDIAVVTMGQSPKSEFYNTDGEGYPFLQGNRTFGRKYPTFDTYTSKLTKMAKAGDVIMSVRAPVGDLNITPVDMCLGRGVCGIRMINGNQDFLFYLLKHNIQQLLNKESGTVFGSVNRNDINGLEIEVPEEEVQKKIASFLAAIDEKIETNEKMNENLLEQANALFSAYFIEQVIGEYDSYKDTNFGRIPETWTLVELGEVGLDISDGNYSAKYPKADEFLAEGIPFIRGTDFDGTTINQDNMMYISPEKHAELKKGHTKKGDILITTRGEIGRIAFVPDSLVDVNINSQLVRINGAGIVPRAYLACFLISKKVQDDFKSLITGSALQQLPVGKLKKVMFLVPDKEILKKFEDNVEPIFQTIFTNTEEIIKLAKIRDMLIPRLMSGELDISEME